MGWVERLNAEKNEEGYLRIEIRPEGYIDRLCSDIALNRRDMRSKFGYTMLYAICPLGIPEENAEIRNDILLRYKHLWSE